MNLLLVVKNVECTAVKVIVDHVEELILGFTAASRRMWLNTTDCTTLFNVEVEDICLMDCTTLFNIDVEDVCLMTFQALLAGSCNVRTSKTI
jgi:sialic acid synthase SpsE